MRVSAAIALVLATSLPASARAAPDRAAADGRGSRAQARGAPAIQLTVAPALMAASVGSDHGIEVALDLSDYWVAFHVGYYDDFKLLQSGGDTLLFVEPGLARSLSLGHGWSADLFLGVAFGKFHSVPTRSCVFGGCDSGPGSGSGERWRGVGPALRVAITKHVGWVAVGPFVAVRPFFAERGDETAVSAGIQLGLAHFAGD